jgi:uncharacterized protein
VTRSRLIWSLALLHLGGAAAGYGAWVLGIPLAWLIGSMLFSTAATLALDAPRPPRAFRYAAQLTVGGAIGLYLTPEALDRILDFSVPILVSAVLITLIAGLIGVAKAKLTGTDRATAIFSSIAGGPMEMANLAERYGGDPGRAAFAQTLRILLIILLYPPLLLASGTGMDVAVTGLADADPAWMALLLVLSLAGAGAAWRLGLANPFFLGPMIVTGVAVSVGGLAIPPPPDTVIWTAQVLLGVSLGTMFRRDLVTAGLPFLASTLATTALLLGVCLAIAQIWTMTMGADFATMALSTAPGAVTEMALTARAMRLDVSLVAAFQVVRIFLSMALLPVVYRMLARI